MRKYKTCKEVEINYSIEQDIKKIYRKLHLYREVGSTKRIVR